MIDFTIVRVTSAPIATVFDALTDHEGMAGYLWWCRRSTLDRQGLPEPGGVGAVRRLEAVGPALVEEIVAYERPTRYAYRMLSGLPTRDHVGTVDLREAGGQTEVRWHLRSTLGVPALDRAMLPVFEAVIRQLLEGAIGLAERRNTA